MTTRIKLSLLLAVTSLLVVATALLTVFWFVPHLRALRTTIDNDRASISVINQQRSTLAKLRSTLESIKTKQSAVEANLWTFIKEDDFFTFFDGLVKDHHVVIDAPSIADATPSDKVIPRAVTITIRGSLTEVLATIDDLQRAKPLIAIQQIGLHGDDRADSVRVSISATTLWR